MTNRPPDQSVAVIGAGISGLSAARALADAGFSVTVFERGRGIGGRTATKTLTTADGIPCKVDCGAQFFSARDSRFIEVVNGAIAVGNVAPWSGRVVKIENGEISESASARYVGVPAMNSLAKHLATGLTVHTATPITTAAFDSTHQRWTLGGDHTRTYCAVVIAMPPEQASRLLTPSNAGAELLNAVSETQSLACWSTSVCFDTPVDLPFDGAFLDHPVLGWAARDSSKPGRSAGERWVLQAAADWSAQRLSTDPLAIAKAMIDAFVDATRHPAVTLRQSVAHRWRFARVEAKPQPQPALWDSHHRLAVCGDWCLRSRVEAAYLSGLAAADFIIEQT